MTTKKYDPMKEPRYAEIATFMRAPLSDTLAEVDIGLIGVPTDLGVTNRPGARHGPREIRNSSSLMRSFNLGLGRQSVRTLQDRRSRRRAPVASVRLGKAGRRDCGIYRASSRGRRAPGQRRRRSLDHVPHIQGDCRRCTHRNGSHRCPYRHLGRVLRIQVHSRSTVSAGRRGRPAGSRSARSKSAFAAARTTWMASSSP